MEIKPLTPEQEIGIKAHDIERTRIVDLVKKRYEEKSSKIQQESTRNPKKR